MTRWDVEDTIKNGFEEVLYRKGKKEVNSMDGDASSKPKSMNGFVRGMIHRAY